ncbi:MAG: tRNA dihydrouridine synthase DusB [Clostridia bacterium]|nr:tRNA dihydrouridine synthase DusB [Clostridia bacterium]
MKINGLELKNGLILAPMAGITDAAFRKICFDYGADFTVSEMVSAKAVCYGDKKTDSLARLENGEGKHTSLQIFGSESEFMAKAAAELLKYEPAAIDINMGCPVPKCVKSGEGSALMKNPKLCAEIVKAVVGAVNVPVSVKIRAGFDSKSINAVEVATAVEQAGVSFIAVHGRTREQMYSGKADLAVIKAVKEAVNVPVIANGDVVDGESALRALAETGADALMLGRGALGRPWIFAEVAAVLEGKAYTELSDEEKCATAKLHLKRLVEIKGEDVAILEARKHIAWYSKGRKNSAFLRNRINLATGFIEMNSLINEVFGL